MKGNEPHEFQHTNSLLQQTPIAIIGMGALFPQARNLHQYWDNILREVDCITEVPPSRWNIEEYYDPDPSAPDKTYCKRGGFIPDVDFNPMEFGIPPNVLEATDISQLLSLVVARQTLKDAGYSGQSDEILARTGVILGVAVGRQLGGTLTSRMQYPIWERVLKSYGIPDADTHNIIERMKAAYVGWQENSFPGTLGNVIAGRIANRFDLGGTNCVVDAACASSLSALKMAISELVEQRCDMMLTGGVDTDNSIIMYMCFSKTPAFSQQDRVRPFDADSDGMLVGEGIGMMALKRLVDAERDQDRIYAVIRGVGSSSDGRFKSIYAPRSEGQATALRRAYQDAGIDPSSIGLVEAHGTGTKAGDPVEVTALLDVLQAANTAPQRVGLGSVKAQIGHTKAAAGAASLIKTALALYHQVLPATINVEQPAAPLTAATSPLYLNTKTRPWLRSTQDGPRRAGVSAFGFGGTNFHVVLEEYVQNSTATNAYRLQSVPRPILLHAATPQGLIDRCTEALTQLRTHPSARTLYELSVASSAADIPREHPRLGFVADTSDEACTQLETALQRLRSQTQTPEQSAEWIHPSGIFYRAAALDPAQKVVALFPGQGSQYLEMGRTLACTMPPVREAFSTIDALFQQDGLESVSRVVFPPPAFDDAIRQTQDDTLRQTQYAQPAIGAFSLALFTLLRQAGFQPDFVLGHSFGELTALWAAGVVNEADYLHLIKARGLAMAAPPAPAFDAGAMLAVQGDVAQIEGVCQEDSSLTIANWNAPDQVVLAGPTAAIDAAQSSLTGHGFKVVRLPVSAAFHTQLVEHAQQPFAETIRHVEINAPAIPVYANATAEPYPAAPSAIRHTMAEHITQPVLFKQQIEQVYAAGGFCFVEVGPKSTLTNLVQRTLADKPHVTVALNASSRKDSDRQYRAALVHLRVLGLPLAMVDPYQAPPPADEPAAANALSVRLTASNYVSEKTTRAYEDALQKGPGIATRPPTAAPAASASDTSTETAVQTDSGSKQNGAHAANPHRSTENNMATLAVAPPAEAQAKSMNTSTDVPVSSVPPHNPHSTEDGQTNGYGPSHSSTNGYAAAERSATEASPPIPQPTATQPDYGRLLDGMERSLTQFMEGQNHSVRVHEHYLDNQGNYTQMFAQLMQQQMDLVNRGATPDQLAAIRTLLETLNQSVAQFHAHQGETTRVHEQYLQQQTDSARTILHILQQQYAAGLDLPAPPFNTKQTQPAVAAQGSPATDAAPTTPAAQPTSTKDEPERTAASNMTPTDFAPPPTAASTVDTAPAVNTAAITEMLLNVVSEKTGYPVDVLEPEMDIEADLGIDSIKRVEILGALQEQFPEMPMAEPEALAELRTLGQIVAFIEENLAAHAAPSPLSPSPNGAAHDTAAPAPAASTPQATGAEETAIDVEAISSLLLTIVSEKTGYPVDVLEPEMDIEADLGIDSIKRVEILGALQEQFPEMPAAEPEALAELRTLGQIVTFIHDKVSIHDKVRNNGTVPAQTPPDGHAAAPVSSENGTATGATEANAAPDHTAADSIPPAPQSPIDSAQQALLSEALQSAIGEKTGLPAAVLDPGAHLENDLGIDRVQRVAIIGTVQDAVPGLPHFPATELGDLLTIEQLTEALARRMSTGAETPPETLSAVDTTDAPDTAETANTSDIPSVPAHTIQRQRVTLQTVPPPDWLEFTPMDYPVCILTDDGGASTIEVAQRLQARGWTVVVLRFPTAIVAEVAAAGREPFPDGLPIVELTDADEAHLAGQLQEIADRHGPVGAFIHMHPAWPTSATNLEFSETEAVLVKLVFLAAKHLRHPLNEAAQRERSCFLTVTRLDGEFGLGGQSDFSAVGAGLFGLTKSLNREWPGVFCRALDVSREWNAPETADVLLAELHDPDGDLGEVAYGARGRVTLTTQPAPAQDAATDQASTSDVRIDADSVFLVSGGARGVTAACVRELAARYGCKFILLGRTATPEPEPEWAQDCVDEAELKKRIVAALSAEGAKPAPTQIESIYKNLCKQREVEETLRQIERAGGQAIYCSTDVTDAAALQEAVDNAARGLGPITGLIHGAGVLADAWIEKKTAADFDAVYAAKVTGLAHLLRCVPVAQLQHILLFSSVAGFYGSIGQTDYALSNEVLNKAAHVIKRHHPDCHVVAINWGPWDGGMVTPALKRIFAMQHIEVIPIEVGTRLFVEELGAANREAAQVVIRSSPVGFGMLSPDMDRPAGELRTFRVRRTIIPTANPFLSDHAIGQQQVLPLTAAAAWMINTCERLNPGYKFLRWTDLKVLKGIVLEGSAPGELRLELQEQEGTSTATITFAAHIWSEDARGKARYHYQGILTLAQHTPAAPHYESFVLEPSSALAGSALYADGTLFHGPAFHGVERVLHLGPDRLTLECRVPAVSTAVQGQFRVRRFDPYLTDVQLQSALIWSRQVKEQGCLPAKVAQYELFELIPDETTFYVSLEVHSYSNVKLVADIIAHNEQGQIYSRLLGSEFTVSNRLAELFEQAIALRNST